MRFFLLLSVFYAGAISGQSNIYDQALQTLHAETISMDAFKGKKILIAAVSPANLQSGSLYFLDSLQKANPAIVVIVIPALDFGGDGNTEILNNIKNDSTPVIIINAAAQVTKASGSLQHSLMNWLTHNTENSHFDAEVSTDNHLFLISETGILYAVLEKGTPLSVIDDLLDQKPVVQ
jgi:glutathione peroxidase-family protein